MRKLMTFSLALLLAACGRLPPGSSPPAGPAQPVARPPDADRPAQSPGWRYVATTREEMRLHAVSPDARHFLMVSDTVPQHTDLLVSLGERVEASRPPVRRITLATPDRFRVDFIATPFGPVAIAAGSDKSNEGAAVSPDLRWAAVTAEGGIWLGDLQTGAARSLTSPKGPYPDDMPPRTPLIWAQEPRRQITADGLFLRSVSPDFRWAAAGQSESPLFRIYNLERPEASVTHRHHPDSYAGPGTNPWSPDSSKVIFHARPGYDLARWLGVLDLQTGQAAYYAFPDPAAGLPAAEGWVGDNQLLVSLRPWNPDFTDYAREAGIQWWLLDLRSVPPLQAAAPGRLLSPQASLTRVSRSR